MGYGFVIKINSDLKTQTRPVEPGVFAGNKQSRIHHTVRPGWLMYLNVRLLRGSVKCFSETQQTFSGLLAALDRVMSFHYNHP